MDKVVFEIYDPVTGRLVVDLATRFFNPLGVFDIPQGQISGEVHDDRLQNGDLVYLPAFIAGPGQSGIGSEATTPEIWRDGNTIRWEYKGFPAKWTPMRGGFRIVYGVM